MDDDDAPKPVLSPLFWLTLGSALLCILAGVIVGVYGPVLFPAHAAASRTLGKPAPPR